MVNCRAPPPSRSEAANQRRSKNRTSLVPTWSNVVGSWCQGVSSSGGSSEASSGPGGERVALGTFADESDRRAAGVVALEHPRHRELEQASDLAVVRIERTGGEQVIGQRWWGHVGEAQDLGRRLAVPPEERRDG